jgi:hypothetical protein
MAEKSTDKAVLQPEVTSIKLYSHGTWLTIKADNVGISASCVPYDHTPGSFAELEFRGIAKEFVQELTAQLLNLLENWDEHSTK